MNLKGLKRLAPGGVIGVAAGLTLLTLLLIIGVVLVWQRLVGSTASSDFWMMLEAFSTAATFATVIGGGFMVLAQLVESVDSRNIQMYNFIVERLMGDEEIEARRWVYTQLPDNPAEGLAVLTPEGQRHVKRVLNSFDHLGFMLQQDWIANEEIVGWISPIVVKGWAKLKPYIEYEAKRRREPDYYAAIRYLAEWCLKWRAEHVPNGETVWVEDAL